MGKRDLTTGKAMVIGATGSIGAICARLLAQAIFDVVLISIEPEKLIDLKRTIEREAPGARVTIGTRTEDLVADRDLVVTATSAFGQRIIDITQCKPGAVICDVARPPDINPAEAALRPDVLVIESGEVLIYDRLLARWQGQVASEMVAAIFCEPTVVLPACQRLVSLTAVCPGHTCAGSNEASR